MRHRWRSHLVAPLALSLALAAVAGCKKEEPSRWDKPSATGASTQPAPGTPGSTEPKPMEGSAFNKFFPKDDTEGHKRVFTQEKTGFAEAKLQKDGQDVAVLSISDTANNPEARAKFEGVTDKVQGFPITTLGKNGSSVLVNNRFQVKVNSQSLDAAGRRAWLERFDLAGLARL